MRRPWLLVLPCLAAGALPAADAPSTRELERINWMEFREWVPSRIKTVLLPLGTLEVVTEGVAAHGSRPAEGRDAIAHVGRVLGELEGLERRLRSGPGHPLMGRGSLHASFVSGGREWSTYPDRCSLRYERRTLQGEDGAGALAEAQAILEHLRAADPGFRAARLDFERAPYVTPPGHPLPALVEECLGRPARHSAMSY